MAREPEGNGREDRQAAAASARARRGFTLVELLLVLGLLATLAALAVPSFQAMLEARRLEAGGEQLRTFLRQARREAIESGVHYRVDVQPGAGRLRVCPAADPIVGGESGSDAAEAPSADARTESGIVRREPLRAIEQLPPGVVLLTSKTFSQWLVGEGMGTQLPQAEPGEPVAAVEGAHGVAETEGAEGADRTLEGESSDEVWLPWFEFYPDGSARLATAILLDGQQRFLEAKVEEMTGEVLLSGPRSAADLDEMPEESGELDQ